MLIELLASVLLCMSDITALCKSTLVRYVLHEYTHPFCVLRQVFALICDAENPQVFTIEFIRGQIRKFCSTER